MKGNKFKNKKQSKWIYSKFKCPVCNGNMVKRTGKFGDFLGCVNYAKKSCRGTRNIDGSVYKRTYYPVYDDVTFLTATGEFLYENVGDLSQW